ncbi:membrane protein [Kitasatospora sp. NE20-6]|uniref:Bax inhibitor-1/YccA family protein n=1 Tax=Kitasatospora sp. NE20-6 TaxID=2859066 RepID=UPI0034DBDE27
MRSSNPVFARRGFRHHDATGSPAVRQPEPVGAMAGGGPEGVAPAGPPAREAAQGLVEVAPAQHPAMTIDDVTTRAGATLGTLVLAAALSWVLLPVDSAGIGTAYAVGAGAALAAFLLAMVQAFRPSPSPALILGYAALEGVFLGTVSDATSAFIAPGVVVQAVLGTMAVFAGVLIAYRRRWIRVTRRFSGLALGAATGLLLLMAADLLFSAFGADSFGFGSGPLGVVFGIAGILLGGAFLALDFKQVEDGIAQGAPREDAWFAAFGLTTTLVWIYLEALQVLSILRGED